MGCDYTRNFERMFRVLLKGQGDTAYSIGGGNSPISALNFREALEIYCAQSDWQPPTPGTRYEYAVVTADGCNLQTFTVEPTPGYTITEH